MMKKYFVAAWSALLTLGGSLLTFLLMMSAKNRRERKEAEARAEHLKNVMTQDKEFEQEHDERTEELADDIKKKKTSSELENPNDW